MERAVFTLLALFVLVPPVSAQVEVQRSPDALTILGQCASAMNADPTMELAAEGEITSPHPTLPARAIVVRSKGADRARVEVSGERERTVFIVNRRRAVRLQDDRVEKLAGQNARPYPPDHLPSLFCRADLLLADFHIRYGGLAAVNGRAAHEIVLFAPDDRLPGGRSRPLRTGMYVYVDAQTFMVVKAAFLIFSPEAIENHSLMEVFYEDYRMVEGCAIPFRMRRVVSGREFETVTFRRVSRTSVPDSDFEEGLSR